MTGKESYYDDTVVTEKPFDVVFAEGEWKGQRLPYICLLVSVVLHLQFKRAVEGWFYVFFLCIRTTQLSRGEIYNSDNAPCIQMFNTVGYKKHKHEYIYREKARSVYLFFSFIIVIIRQWRLRRKTYNFFFRFLFERPSLNRLKKSCTHPSAIVHQNILCYLSYTRYTRHIYKIVAAFCCILLLLLFYMYNTRKVFMFSDICIKEHKIFIYFTIMVVRSRHVYT